MQMDQVFLRLFLPLARLAIGRGLGFRDVTDPLKRAFLVAASEGAGRPTDSRLALATGLQRRDVARLRDQGVAPRAPSSPARIVSDWLRGPATVGSDGEPLDLPLRAGSDGPSFEALAKAVRQDVHPRTLLDLLVDAGTVEVDGDVARLVSQSYAPGGGSPEQVRYLADNLYDHGAAAVANVLSQVGHFDRAAHYSGLTQEQAEGLAARFDAAQSALLQDIAAEAAAMQDDGPIRVRFGGYSYSEESE